MNYRQALRWLFGLQRFGIKLGLENTKRLFAALEVPRPNEQIIHVAGTNGKGSVCAMLAAISRAAGYRTGLFTSPHLITFCERIQIDGAMITAGEVARGLTQIEKLVSKWQPHPTFFEITTALALRYFADAKVDLLVLETGMGGRLDATNAVTPIVSVLTPIDYDHQKWLGHTLKKIASEKAGIIKRKIPVVSATQRPAAAAVIRARAKVCHSPLQFVKQPARLPVSLAGAHQQENAALAIAALAAAKISVSDEAVFYGLGHVQWPARFQRWNENIVIDGAHNPAGARVLVKTFREVFREQKARVICAILADKNVAKICAILGSIAEEFLLPKIYSERALAPASLRRTLSQNHPDIPVSLFPSFAAALESAQRGLSPILITGSLHFAGEALAHLRGEEVEDCLQ